MRVSFVVMTHKATRRRQRKKANVMRHYGRRFSSFVVTRSHCMVWTVEEHRSRNVS